MSLSLLCASQATMSVTCTAQEIQCTLHWFQSWSAFHKEDFMKSLLEKAVPEKMVTLFDAMDTLDVSDKPPSIFKCQMKLFNQWFDGWDVTERNEFLNSLEARDPEFVGRLNKAIAETSGQP